MHHMPWQAWCAAALLLLLIYWLTRGRKPKKRLPGHKHYCPVCQKEFTCLDDDCTSFMLKEHPRCEAGFRTRGDRGG